MWEEPQTHLVTWPKENLHCNVRLGQIPSHAHLNLAVWRRRAREYQNFLEQEPLFCEAQCAHYCCDRLTSSEPGDAIVRQNMVWRGGLRTDCIRQMLRIAAPIAHKQVPHMHRPKPTARDVPMPGASSRRLCILCLFKLVPAKPDPGSLYLSSRRSLWPAGEITGPRTILATMSAAIPRCGLCARILTKVINICEITRLMINAKIREETHAGIY